MPDSVFNLLPILFQESDSSVNIVTRLDGPGVVLRFQSEARENHSTQTGTGAHVA
jgi:hypothetical protein